MVGRYLSFFFRFQYLFVVPSVVHFEVFAVSLSRFSIVFVRHIRYLDRSFLT